MTARMLLDESGDNPVAADYTRVADEVTFLRRALTQPRLHVCGEIGAWAAALCEARGWEYRRLSTPAAELMAACPGLAPAAAAALVERLRPALGALQRPLQPLAVAASLWPTAGLWADEPGASHAARWLEWIIVSPPSVGDRPLMAAIADRWRAAVAGDRGLAAAYRAATSEEAWEHIKEWLGVAAAPSANDWPAFPLKPLPGWMITRLRAEWDGHVIRSSGRFFEQFALPQVDPDARRLLVTMTAIYFKQHPTELSSSIWQRLEPLLSAEWRRDLEARVLPPDPGTAPPDLEAAVAWFQGPYLRFRLWEAAYGQLDHRERRRALSRAFGSWYVDAYARAITGGPGRDRLSWSKTAALVDRKDRVTLLVVLDGLGYRDARTLLDSIRERTDRLTLTSDDVAMAPLPTITEFAKLALLTGLTPVRAVDEAKIGTAERHQAEVIQALNGAVVGDIVIWSLLEPDKTYHQQLRGDDAAHAIAGALMTLARRIVAVADAVREEIALRLVIATDHGRMLSMTDRRVPVPASMAASGRAAWGASDQAFGVEGYRIDGDVAYLDATRFSIKRDQPDQTVAVLLSDESFLMADGRGGNDPYPHGGVYPEEVFIPWLEFLRDASVVAPEVILTGDGEAGTEGAMTLEIVNMAPVSIRLDALTVPTLGWTIGLEGTILAPLASREISLRRAPWPRPAELEAAQARLAYALPSGELRDQAVVLKLTSEELYGRRDDILSDL